jgi:hypothetical protein
MEKDILISKLEQLRNLADECLNSLLREDDPAKGNRAITARSFSGDVDFGTPARPFMKAFVALSGAKKFALLVAWTVKGDLEKQVPLAEVEALWSSMAGMLGLKFNRKFSSDARESDWVECKKAGRYNLRPNWKHILDDRRGQ